MKAILFIEGGASGAHSNQLQKNCREGFATLLLACGFAKRMPQLVSCGSRNEAFKKFAIACKTDAKSHYIAMWIDSEDPLKTIEETWEHLASRDNWTKPAGAKDDQVLFMTTCMETLIVADRAALKEHYRDLQESALPPLTDLESRHRQDVQDKLAHASRACSNAYAKGKRSFEILAKLDPDALQLHLPSFKRTCRILKEKLELQ